MTVPAFDLSRQYAAIKPEIDAAVAAVLAGGSFILGENVSAFEKEFSDYCGVGYAVGVGSGTEALHVALLALGIGAGDEVITVPHTAVATVAAVELAGARAVLVDVDPQTMTMDTSSVEERITSRTKAILPVHLYGQTADLDPLLALARRRNVALIEDCAQAHGAEYRAKRAGSLGIVGCFSFYPTKNLGAYGDGGMIVTSDETVARRLRLFREYGWEQRYVSSVRGGTNSRLDELQAALLRVKLRHLDEWTEARRARATEYNALLAGSGVLTPLEMEYALHVYHLYVIRSRRRDALRQYLRDHGVGTAIHYPVPVHLQPGYADLGNGLGSFPVSEKLAGEILSLPMFPELTSPETQQTASLIRQFEAQ
jgi:dTDP-4-amino-4,6-dideoxygalactose transaminase